MVDTISNVNAGIVNSLANIQWMTILGWVFAFILLIGAIIFLYMWYRNKKVFNKQISVFEIVGGYYQFAFRDTAKVVKIGAGGFEILFLKKQKVYRIGYGGRVGRGTYYFFIAPDGYWYNGMLSADLKAIDKANGLIPIVTTNASMRAQYTSLEKQIAELHSQKKGFMEKYGSWVFGIIFILVAGVMLWLMYKEMAGVMSSMSGMVDKIATLVDRINNLLASTQGLQGQGGLVPA